MTAHDNQAITELSKHLETYITENRLAHGEIKDAIEKITAHCALREEEVDSRLKEREAKVDKQFSNHETHMREEICEAKDAAVLKATAPSPLKLVALAGWQNLLKIIAIIGTSVGIAVGVDKLLG